MRTFLLVCLTGCAFFPQSIFASGREANALLQGARNEILKYDRFRVRYDETRNEEKKTISQIVDYDRGRIRKELLGTDDFPGWIDILNDDVCYRFKRKENEDVKIAASDSELARHSGLFDPRILFLGNIPFTNRTVESRLPCDKPREATITDDFVNGVKVKRIVRKNGDDTWEYCITEPGFRVMKVSCSSPSPPSILFTTTNKYDDSRFGPFPSEIHIHREDAGKTTIDWHITVTSFENLTSFAPDAFAYESMDIPVNTAVVDYRINQRLGYWDGEKLSPTPVSDLALAEREEAFHRETTTSAFRWILIGVGFLLIVLAVCRKLRFPEIHGG